MKRAIILDDEQSAIDELKSHLTAFDFIQVVDTFNNLRDAEKGIIQYKPDLLFLDIRIKGEYVFALLEKLRQRNIKYAIIFISGYFQEHLYDVMESCNFSPFDYGYVHKPIDKSLLEKVLAKFQNYSNGSPQNNLAQDSIIIKDLKQGYTRVKFEDIIYFRSSGNYVDVFFREGDKLASKAEKTTLKELEKILPPDDFYRMSNAAIIKSKCFHQTIPKTKNTSSCILKDNVLGILDGEHILDIPEGKWKAFRERFGFL